MPGFESDDAAAAGHNCICFYRRYTENTVMDLTPTLKSFVDTARDRDITFLAASFSYYAFVSFIPMLILAVALSSFLGRSLVDPLLDQLRTISPPMATLVRNAVANSSGRLTAGVVSVVTLLWSAFKVFRGLDNAFERVYDAAADVGLLTELRDAVVVLFLVVVAVAVMGVVAAVSHLFAGIVPFPRLVTLVGGFVGLFLVFVPVYYVMPPLPVSLSHVLPGAAFAAVGWSVLHALFVYYVSNAAQYKAYGVLGGILLFVTFLYLFGVLLLAGAVLNVTLERASPRSELFQIR